MLVHFNALSPPIQLVKYFTKARYKQFWRDGVALSNPFMVQILFVSAWSLMVAVASVFIPVNILLQITRWNIPYVSCFRIVCNIVLIITEFNRLMPYATCTVFINFFFSYLVFCGSGLLLRIHCRNLPVLFAGSNLVCR